MVLHKKGKKTLTRVAGRWGALQEVRREDKQRSESSEGERQVCVFHMHVPVGRMHQNVSGNTELGATPSAGQNRILLYLLGSSRVVCSQSLLLYSHSPRFLYLCWFGL